MLLVWCVRVQKLKDRRRTQFGKKNRKKKNKKHWTKNSDMDISSFCSVCPVVTSTCRYTVLYLVVNFQRASCHAWHLIQDNANLMRLHKIDWNFLCTDNTEMIMYHPNAEVWKDGIPISFRVNTQNLTRRIKKPERRRRKGTKFIATSVRDPGTDLLQKRP